VFGGKKPVYVLTSHQPILQADDFTYALQNLKRSKIIGEGTGDGAHPTRMFKVTDHFVGPVFAHDASIDIEDLKAEVIVLHPCHDFISLLGDQHRRRESFESTEVNLETAVENRGIMKRFSAWSVMEKRVVHQLR